MDQPVEFVPARTADLHTVLGLMAGLYAHDGLPLDAGAAETAVRDLIDHPDYGQLWLIVRNGEVAGYVVMTLGFSLEYLGRDAFIDELFIDAKYRGQGIGRAAIEFVVEQCHHLGVKALHLEVERQNVAAQGFYRRLKFADHDRFLLTRVVARTEATS